MRAFLDTGNSLYDVDGRPVIVMEICTFIKIFPDFPLYKVIMQQQVNSILSNFHYIQANTINSCEKLFAFDVEYIIVKSNGLSSKHNNVCIAVSKRQFKDYNLILHRSFC